MSVRVVSREPQAFAIADFLSSIVAAPSALVIEGEPGIGKTTLWLETIERAKANGFRVMAARPVAAESVLAYTSLADLLDGIDTAILAELPEPQRVALDCVLLRGDAEDAPADQRAVAAGFLSVVTILAEMTSVLVAVDALQWLASSSRLVVAFVARRLAGRVGVVAHRPLPAVDDPGPVPATPECTKSTGTRSSGTRSTGAKSAGTRTAKAAS